MRQFLSLILFIFLVQSCQKANEFSVDVSNIKVNLQVDRFDQDFYESSTQDLSGLKVKYPLFLPENVPDSIWLQKKQDRDELELYQETQKIYDDFEQVEKELISLFKHIKYYFPDFTTPRVTTVLSNIDYDYRVVYKQNHLIISLDVYLGKANEFYANFPPYIRENNTKEAIVVDVAKAIIPQFLPRSMDRTFLGKMIYEGKKQYLLDLWLPHASEKLKSGYSLDKLKWAKNNEEQVWKYFIDKDLLYSTDSKLDQRFLNLAPFSKFYLQLDNESPGQIGIWVGAQIVRSFMKKNDVSLSTLFAMDTQEIFKKSKYKPRN